MELSTLKLSVVQRLLNRNDRQLFDHINQLLDITDVKTDDELTPEQHKLLDKSLAQLRNGQRVARATVQEKANKLLKR